MLIETMDFAVTNREEILLGLDFHKQETVVARAKELWHDFTPGKRPAALVGIDSSWNFVPYQGFYIYAVDAISILQDGSHLVPPRYEVGLSTLTIQRDSQAVSNPRIALASIGMEYELEQIRACMNDGGAELVAVDGSILARYYDRRHKEEGPLYEKATELMKKRDLLFLSKTSYSNVVLGGEMGDMFYFNRISSRPGYSEPILDRSGVSVSYVRLAECSPCVKLEVPVEAKDGDVQSLLDVLSYSSVDGYPYVLRLAHEESKVSHEDMEKLANLLGLNTEIGGRQVLGE